MPSKLAAAVASFKKKTRPCSTCTHPDAAEINRLHVDESYGAKAIFHGLQTIYGDKCALTIAMIENHFQKGHAVLSAKKA